MKHGIPFIALFFLLTVETRSQPNIHPASTVADAEKSFAKKALETNTRTAFLEYYADNVVVFRNGNPVNGKDDWSKRKPDSSELWWQPVFADISLSGDFGYTTGPWEWKKKKNDNQPSGYGYYNSIWRKIPGGSWKVVIDIGVPVGMASPEKNKPTTYPVIRSKPVSGKYESLRTELVGVEKAFLDACRTNGNAAYNIYSSRELRLYRPNHLPFTAADAISKALADTSLSFTFQPMAGDIASSGDIGYVYGKVKATGIYNGQPVNADLSYMRIWKRENDGQWKIVLDVIGGN